MDVTAPAFPELRAREFARLDASGLAYLDYTGSGLAPRSLVETHAERLLSTVHGNPHSEHGPSKRATEEMEDARRAVLHFFGGDPDDYTVVFTPNASGAIRLVGEAFPFSDGGRLALTVDNHNSVNGLREFAKARGAEVRYVSEPNELRRPGRRASLAAFPAQSNFSGRLYPLAEVRQLRRAGWRVLLDAAAYVPTHRLDLREVPVDFVCLSFYKMMGYPTGVGALVARREALALLRRPWFAGGTVEWATTASTRHRLVQGPSAFEDGTPPFLAMGAVRRGLDFLEHVGMARITRHVDRLTGRLVRELADIRHGNGAAAVRIYGPTDPSARGGTVAFNLLDRGGRVLPYGVAERAARDAGIAVRGGCFCNPGAAELAFGLDGERMLACLERTEPGRFAPPALEPCLGHDEVGALRASLGLASNAADVNRLVDFVRRHARERERRRASSRAPLR